MLPQIVQIVTPIALSGRMVASKGQRATAEVPCTRHVLWRRCYGRRVAWAIIFVFVCFVLFVVSPLPPCLPFYWCTAGHSRYTFRPASRSHNALCVHLMYECVCVGGGPSGVAADNRPVLRPWEPQGPCEAGRRRLWGRRRDGKRKERRRAEKERRDAKVNIREADQAQRQNM